MSEQRICGQLIESAARRRRGTRPLVASVVTHGALIALAVAGTRHPRVYRARHEPVEAVQLARLSPAPAPRTAQPTHAAPAPRGFQVLQAPDIATTLPPVDLTQPATVAENFTGKGIAGGIAGGVAAAELRDVGPGYIESSVADDAPYLLPGQIGPDYPDVLRDAAPDGYVLVRFVLDTLGNVEPPTLAVVQATHPLFVRSVQSALTRLHFAPARFSGKRVRARMEQRFEFHLAGR